MAGITTAEKDGAPVPGKPTSRKVQEVPISSAFTMSPTLSPIPLSPMPAASYIDTMTKNRARHGTYLFQRGSTFYVKLRNPAGRVEKSLRTSDRREAEIAALPLIAAHKGALLAARPTVTLIWHRAHEPGLRVIDGEQAIVTERELQFIDASGNVIRREPNGGPAELLTPAPSSGVPSFKAYDDAKRPTPAVKNGDDELLEVYLRDANISGHYEQEARATWAIYKKLTNSKPLKNATREDGKLLAQHFKDAGNKSATAVKKIGWLRAAVRLAIKDGKLTFNPFAEVVSENGDDELRRRPLSDAEIELCKKNLGKLSESDQLLFRFLATTGARLGEAFQIDGEQIERDVRYVVIGSKTEASQRRLPLPADLLPYLPTKIIGSLFTAKPSIDLAVKAASKRLNDFLDECGLTYPSIVVHSLRHRAADRLRAYECPIDIRHALLGHETRSVAE
jgi:integrase